MRHRNPNPTHVVIRRALREDYGAFCRLFPELMVDDPVPGLEAWCAVLCPSTWMATEDGEVLGYCYFQEYVETGYVRNVVVAPAARRRGVARALMESIAAHLRSRGKRSWCLNVKPSNEAALALYARLGMRARYPAKMLRLPWASLEALPTGSAVIHILQPARDAVVEQRFDIPRGQLAFARGMGRLLFEATQGVDCSIGLAAFDRHFPGAFPFRVTDFDALEPLLRTMRHHVPTDEYVNLVAENDQALADLLTAAGASLRDEIIHMEGAL